MEELENFFWELYKEDLAREAEAIGEARSKAKGRAQGRAQGRAEGIAQGRAEGEVRGKAEGIVEAIRNFISNRPKGNKVTASAIAALFGIDEGLAHSILSA